MTVREAADILVGAKKLYLSWEGTVRELDTEDALMMDAFGMYQVSKIMNSCEPDCFEIHIAAKPIKEVSA
ncbi:hypothetical protein D1641_09600 [Colidextribacter sp. OB.20]|uniref:hypothetical protein n=1 Tax=Colidextribacter sp. OB.20 TaxID=2304568 RepID=UPI001371C722|nr:hypothetical protein [Colidextribacter sp. OB.20]NBI10262.1 hypothetical protein [Colidextribacter sp. OB.20]